MSDLIKVLGVGLTAGMLVLTIKEKSQGFAVLTAVAGSIVILAIVFSQLGEVVTQLYTLISISGVNIEYIAICFKAVGMAYISEFVSQILHDCGENAIAAKVETAGKICILALTVPVIENILKLCIKVVNSV